VRAYRRVVILFAEGAFKRTNSRPKFERRAKAREARPHPIHQASAFHWILSKMRAT
jgi:hypothetical protein